MTLYLNSCDDEWYQNQLQKGAFCVTFLKWYCFDIPGSMKDMKRSFARLNEKSTNTCSRTVVYVLFKNSSAMNGFARYEDGFRYYTKTLPAIHSQTRVQLENIIWFEAWLSVSFFRPISSHTRAPFLAWWRTVWRNVSVEWNLFRESHTGCCYLS